MSHYESLTFEFSGLIAAADFDRWKIETLRGKPDMTDQNELKAWIESNYPLFWSLLNRKAQRTLPKGLIEHIDVGSPPEIKIGRDNLIFFERWLAELKILCGWKTVSDNYRPALSGVDSEDQVAELFCEIVLCASVGRFSGKLQLHPPTEKRTHSDCLFNVNGVEIYGEVKRYIDPWPYIEKLDEVFNEKEPYTRSLAQRPSCEKPQHTARARSMDLRSKLQDVHRQFPQRSLNILFVFHSSITEKTQQYITQALFGDSNLWSTDDPVLESDGLFSMNEWCNISAGYLAHVNRDSKIIYLLSWKNPRALTEIPREVFGGFPVKAFVQLAFSR